MSGIVGNFDSKLGEMHCFFDSSFPIGYFSQSYGFEFNVSRRSESQFEDYHKWIINYLVYSIWYSELMVLSTAHELYKKDRQSHLDQILQNDAELYASRSTPESRKASISLSRAIRLAANDFFSDNAIELRSYNLKEPSSLIGILAAMQDWNFYNTRLLYLQSHALSITHVILRHAKMGQSSQLTLLAQIQPTIVTLASVLPSAKLPTIGALCFGIELSQIHHQHQSPRLFQS